MSLKLNRRTVLNKIMAVGAAMILFRTVPVAQGKKTATHVIEIKQFVFSPGTLRIHVGDSVTWVNRDIVPHTATATDNSWDTGEIRANESTTVLMNKASVPEYFCRFHPSMKAELQIIVDS